MKDTVEVLLPIAEGSAPEVAPLAPRLPTLEGRRIGLITNGWRSLGVVYDLYRQRLIDDRGVRDVVEKRATPSGPIVEDDYQDLLGAVDGVIVGLAN